MKLVETDPESGAEVYLLGGDARPADNIYGEQPYSSADGSRIVIRYYPIEGQNGGLSILDLNSGELFPVIEEDPRFPAFHGWGEYLYYQQQENERLVLKRCNYLTLEKEDITDLPTEEGRFSYGTTSQDHRYYAASVHPEGGTSKVICIDLSSGECRTLAHREEYHFKHEQFSLDGRNRILIQANKLPDVAEVHLGALEPNKEGVTWFPVDRPHTPRPTGHEAWIGETDSIFISTARDEAIKGNLWTAGLQDDSARLVETEQRCAHVSVSKCGNYWIGDATGDDGVPLHVGSLETGNNRRAAFSRTVHDREQWSHAHPYMTADNGWLIFTAKREGHPQVYGAKIPEGFLAAI